MMTMIAALGILAPSQAALLVYEGFDISASGGDSLHGLAGASSKGLAGTWNVSRNGTQEVRYESDTLTFGSGATALITAPGRAVFISDSTNSHTGFVRADRAFDITDPAPRSTLYGSYLFRVEQRIPDINRYETWYFHGKGTAGSERYNINTGPIGWQGNRGVVDIHGAPRLNQLAGTGYPNPAAGDMEPTLMALYQVEGINGSTGAGSTATMWVLNSDQFDHFRAVPGGLDASVLSAAATGTGSAQVMQKAMISNTNLDQWPQLLNGELFGYRAERGGTSDHGDGGWMGIDEMRLSLESLNAVTPIGGADRFRITDITIDADNGDISVTWNSIPRRFYGLFYSTDLSDWGADIDDNIEATGDTTRFTFPNPLGDATELFFRVEEN